MDTNIITTIGGIVILICIIIAMVIRYKSKQSFDKNLATKFLDGLSDTFYNKILDIINNTDFSAFNSLEELESSILNDIYDSIWEYVEEQLKDSAKTDVLTALALKFLNKDFVNKFVDNIIESCNIEWKIESLWADKHNFEEKVKEISDNDKSKFVGSDYIENYSGVSLEAAKEEEIPQEELDKLNPQKDEEEKLDPDNDESVEIIEDDEVVVDSNGRKRNKKTGRYV